MSEKINSERSVMLTGLFFLLSLFLLSPPATVRANVDVPLIAMDGQKIVTGSAVRIRTQPSLESEVVGYLGLGAVVRATRRTRDKLQTGDIHNYWYRVQPGTRHGWVSGRFLRDFKPQQKEQIWFEIIKTRLDNPDLSFAERVALHEYAALVMENSRDEKLQGAFALGEILSLQKAFDQVDFEIQEHEPYARWIEKYQEAGRVFRDEVSGQWLVPPQAYWQLADSFADRPGGDEIAWYAANARLGGECEGDPLCDLGSEQLTQGEYLRRYPFGRYAGASLQRLSDVMTHVQAAITADPLYLKQTHTPETVSMITELEEIIANANPKLSERAKAFGQIRAIRRAYTQAGG